MLQEWQTATVVSITEHNSTTRSFFLQIDNTNNFAFEAGQFITLDLPIHEQKNKRWRSYSIASHPNGTNIIELVIVLLPNGVGTTYLFDNIIVGSSLTFRGALGKFVLPQTIETDIYFICTGTGVAPFRSMINYIFGNNIPHQNLYLVFGCRTINDCLYKDELLLLQQQFSSFKYLPCLSREENLPNFATQGYVHNAYSQRVLANRNNNENKPSLFYLCGWKNMIDEAKQTIVDLGYDKKDIHLELYG